jgi:hypothetical protein
MDNKVTQTGHDLLNSVGWVRERTTPTQRQPLVGEVGDNFWGQRVPHGQHNGSPTTVISVSRPGKLGSDELLSADLHLSPMTKMVEYTSTFTLRYVSLAWSNSKAKLSLQEAYSAVRWWGSHIAYTVGLVLFVFEAESIPGPQSDCKD